MKIITLLHNSAQKKCLHKIKKFEKDFKIEFVTPVDKHDKNKLAEHSVYLQSCYS